MIKPFTEALAGFTGLICSLFFIGIVIWCITAFIDREVTNAMWITLTILVIGYGSTLSLYNYIKQALE